MSSMPDLYEIGERVDEYLEPHVRMMDFSGAILIADEGGTIVERAYGMADYEHNTPNTPETRFHVASLTKPFTATLILQLAEEGRLDLHEPLTEVLPGYPEGESMTIHDLLVHTSGIPNCSELPDYPEMQMRRLELGEIVSWFMDRPLANEPGERYAYSNSNYVLLAHIIEKVTASTYRETLRERILDHFGMEDTGNFGREELVEGRARGYSPAPGGLMNAPWYDMSIKLGSGSLYSTPRDLHKFVVSLHAEGLLSGESRRQMFSPHTGKVGYGWFVDELLGRRVSRSSGSSPGFMAHMVRFVEDGLTVIYCSNVRTGLGFHLHRDLSAILLGRELKMPEMRRPMEADEDYLSSYAGRYGLGDTILSMEVKKGHLWMRYGNYPHPMHLTPISRDLFFSRDRYDTLRFVRDDEGRIARIEARGPLANKPRESVWVRMDGSSPT